MIETTDAGRAIAQAFTNRCVAAGVTITPTQRRALGILGSGIAAIGVEKFVAVYPFIGGTAAAHALDMIGSNDITWNGTLTHNSSGVTGDGSTGYGATGVTGSSLGISDGHLAAYMGTSTTGGSQTTVGSLETTDRYCILGWLSSGTKEAGVIQGGLADYAPTGTSAADTGFLAVSATAGRSNQFYNDSGALGTASVPTATAQARELYVAANNNVGTASVFCSRRIQFVSIGGGLTSGEVATFSTAVEAFQTALGRNV